MTGVDRLTAMRPLAVCLALAATAAPAAADSLKVGDRLAELDIAVDGNGKPFKLKALKGSWVLVTVGAEWCKPCAKELPAWDAVQPEYKDKVRFVAINIDDEIDDGKKFNKKLKLKNLTLVYMPADKSGVVSKYGSDTMPTTYVADPQGVVRFVKSGFEKGDASGEQKRLRAALAKLIK